VTFKLELQIHIGIRMNASQQSINQSELGIAQLNSSLKDGENTPIKELEEPTPQ